ncbi:MAG: glycerophosphodiester phosphodiesterase [Candidatus Thermoplasmatota archaeon]|nr:glycerophosphodiester phosphodiesterase [Candidatus Thermoplasmatota archaeon]
MAPLIISHRGKVDLSSSENSLVGIQEAIDLGVNMIEFDVRNTVNDVLVCYHDESIKGKPISHIEYEEMKALDNDVCKLEEVIELCKNKVGVNVEIKEEGYEQKIIDLLVPNFSYADILITSFKSKVIRKIKLKDSKLTTGFLIGESLSYNTFYRVIKESFTMREFLYSKADFVSPYYKIYEIGLMYKFKKLKVPIQLWTVNNLSLLKDLINRDIHSVVTDVSGKLLQEL